MTKRINENIDYTLSTFAVEGLRPSKKAIQLYKEMSGGKRSLADTLSAIEKEPTTTSFILVGYRLCVCASGSLITDIFSCFTWIRVSCLHFGQKRGKF